MERSKAIINFVIIKSAYIWLELNIKIKLEKVATNNKQIYNTRHVYISTHLKRLDLSILKYLIIVIESVSLVKISIQNMKGHVGHEMKQLLNIIPW